MFSRCRSSFSPRAFPPTGHAAVGELEAWRPSRSASTRGLHRGAIDGIPGRRRRARCAASSAAPASRSTGSPGGGRGAPWDASAGTRSVTAAASRADRLGRRRAPVSPRLARLPLGNVRRDVRRPHHRRARALPALGGNRSDRNRRAADARRAARAAFRPRRSRLAGRSSRAARTGSARAARASTPASTIPRHGAPVLAAGDATVVTAGAVARLRLPRRARARLGRHLLVRAPVQDRRRPGQRVARARPSASSARPGTRPGRTSTSRCACAAPRSTRYAPCRTRTPDLGRRPDQPRQPRHDVEDVLARAEPDVLLQAGRPVRAGVQRLERRRKRAATSSAAIAASVRSPSSSCTMRPAQ